MEFFLVGNRCAILYLLQLVFEASGHSVLGIDDVSVSATPCREPGKFKLINQVTFDHMTLPIVMQPW